MSFSHIPLYDFSTNFLFNHLVNGSAMLSLDLTLSKEINPIESSCLMLLCLQRICLDLPLSIMFCALPIADWLSQCMHTEGTCFGHLGISSRKWCTHSVSSPYLSIAINSYFIIDRAITVCLKDFHEIVAPSNVNT